ncbi:MAG: carboxymuconolactone decarboxylase family protein [Acidimicrobiia bacterium]
MSNPPQTPRIAPLPPEKYDAHARELLGAVGAEAPGEDPSGLNIFTTLVRHPGLFRRWLPFAGKLLSGKLPARERELLILRTGWRCRSEYEWGQHVLIGLASGLTEEEIARVKNGADASGWDPFDAALLRAADELHDDNGISDATWDALAGRYDERQLIEVPMLVGQYHLVAYTLNTLGVQREAGVPGLDG